MTLQFLGESVITSILALFLAVGVTDLVLPEFNEFAGKALQMNWIHWSTIVFLLCVSLVTGLLGGIYPAFVLGSYAPVKSLKKTSMSLPGKFSLRKLVVVLQFTISIVLVCGTFVIFSQVKYMLNKDLGLNAEHVIVLPTHGDPLVHEKVDSFFERLSNKSSVLNYSISELSPGDPVYGIVASFEGKEIINYPTTGIDYGWLDTYKMKLKAGRNFQRDQPLDTLERVIINETLCKTLGWTADEAIGKRYDFGGDGENVGEVIGVVEDFNFTSVKSNVQPIVLGVTPIFYQKISIRIRPTDMDAAIAEVRNAWHEVYPTRPFDFKFADAIVDQQYQKEKRFGKIFMLFSIVAVTIGLLGLFGVASLELKFRMKEVGIRKVLGASVTELLITLSKDFTKLTLLAFMVSVPLGHILISKWLEDFAYRLPSITGFVIWPGLVVIALASIVVVLQVLKSTSVNPVETLRNE